MVKTVQWILKGISGHSLRDVVYAREIKSF